MVYQMENESDYQQLWMSVIEKRLRGRAQREVIICLLWAGLIVGIALGCGWITAGWLLGN
jgi:hypothetical protein